MIDNQKYEKIYVDEIICGVDEVGRGPLVGPVVAVSVILPKNYHLDGLTDSKKLSKKKRELYYNILCRDAISYGIGVVSAEEIDKINILNATKKAMLLAISQLKPQPTIIFTDFVKLDTNIPQINLIKGDLLSISISAASVIAKVYRDRLMLDLAKKYPYYKFEKNSGYPTKEHLEAIKKHGIIPEHRKSYKPIKEAI